MNFIHIKLLSEIINYFITMQDKNRFIYIYTITLSKFIYYFDHYSLKIIYTIVT